MMVLCDDCLSPCQVDKASHPHVKLPLQSITACGLGPLVECLSSKSKGQITLLLSFCWYHFCSNAYNARLSLAQCLLAYHLSKSFPSFWEGQSMSYFPATLSYFSSSSSREVCQSHIPPQQLPFIRLQFTPNSPTQCSSMLPNLMHTGSYTSVGSISMRCTCTYMYVTLCCGHLNPYGLSPSGDHCHQSQNSI